MEPWPSPCFHPPPAILRPARCPSPRSPHHHGEASLTMAPCSWRTALSLHCLGPTVSSPRCLAEVTTQTFLPPSEAKSFASARSSRALPAKDRGGPCPRGQHSSFAWQREVLLLGKSMSSVTYGFHLSMVHHSTNRAACVEKRACKARLEPVHLPLYGLTKPTWPPPFLCWDGASTGQDSAGEAGSNVQPKALPSLHGSRWGLPRVFRGLDGLGVLKLDFLMFWRRN